MNTKFDIFKNFIKTIYNNMFRLVYIGNYNELNKLYDNVKNKMLEIENNDDLILTNNYNILKQIVINIFELKNPMSNLDILNLFLNN